MYFNVCSLIVTSNPFDVHSSLFFRFSCMVFGGNPIWRLTDIFLKNQSLFKKRQINTCMLDRVRNNKLLDI